MAFIHTPTRFVAASALSVVLVPTSLPSLPTEDVVVFEDTFDTGVEEWTYLGSDAATMTWDEADGAANPGSLAVAVTQIEGDTQYTMSPCFRATSESEWDFSGQFKGIGTLCTPVIWLYYESDDCTGAFLTSLPDQARPEWEPMDSGGGFSYVSPTGPFSVRGGLATFSSSPGTCKMDDVRVFARGLATPVPTTGIAGTTVLSLVLLLTAFVVLRRR